MNPARPKRNFPTHKIRQLLESGPVVLVSSAWEDDINIMTMGWHTVMEFTPALVGCIIAGSNHSFDLIRKSGECVINLPEAHLATKVVGIGNCTGADTDKFKKFGLTPVKAGKVQAPLIAECYASFECRIHDKRLINSYNFFIFEVVKAHVASTPKTPETIHYRGGGKFMVSGRSLNLQKKFKPQNL